MAHNYSNPFCNYSNLCWIPLGFIGREEKRRPRRVDPAFEIYYYSIAGRAKQIITPNHLMATYVGIYVRGGHDAGLNVCMSGVLLRAFVQLAQLTTLALSRIANTASSKH